MIELCHQEEKYLPICKHYRAVFDTPSIQEDSEKMKEVSLTPHWAKSPKKQSEGVRFCTQNTVPFRQKYTLQIAFSAILPTESYLNFTRY